LSDCVLVALKPAIVLELFLINHLNNECKPAVLIVAVPLCISP
jgi:hypothetical protein